MKMQKGREKTRDGHEQPVSRFTRDEMKHRQSSKVGLHIGR